MGRNGTLYLYTKSKVREPQKAIAAILNASGATSASLVYRSTSESQDWKYFQLEQEAPDDEILAKQLPLEKVPGLYQDGRCLTVDVGKSKWGEDLHATALKKIPQEDLGDFAPGQLVIHCGYHDLFECAEHEDGLLIARAFLSVGFFGYGSPADWSAAREALLALEIVDELEKAVEQACGVSFDRAVFWNV